MFGGDTEWFYCAFDRRINGVYKGLISCVRRGKSCVFVCDERCRCRCRSFSGRQIEFDGFKSDDSIKSVTLSHRHKAWVDFERFLNSANSGQKLVQRN